MHYGRLGTAITSGALAACTLIAHGDGDRTVGVLERQDGMQPGYTLYSPLQRNQTVLLDELGRVVNEWESAYGGLSVYLLPNGELLRTGNSADNDVFQSGGQAGVVERFNWEGDVVWTYLYSTPTVRMHHDIEPLPNGNVLILAWEYKTAAEAIAVGRGPGSMKEQALWPDHIIEVRPTNPTSGEIVWEWHVWDHLVQDRDSKLPNFGSPADNPGRIDINYDNDTSADWQHGNGIDYDAELDQILLSVRAFDEIWIIDHDTTSEEAAGPAGDLLYRWGNPLAYGRGTASDQMLFGQHDVKWVRTGMPGEGNITIFNNGAARPEGAYTSFDELTPPLQPDGTYLLEALSPYGPEQLVWSYVGSPPESVFASRISGCHRLPNGNTLGCLGTWGEFLEVDTSGNVLWHYINPLTPDGPLHQGDTVPPAGSTATQNQVFRAERYAPEFPGFEGRDLVPGDYLEIYPECLGDVDNDRLVDGADLTIVLGSWGTNDPRADLDENGLVDGADLTSVLGAWGPCPNK